MCAARGRREEEEEGEEREPVARREWECRIEEGTVAIAEAPRSGRTAAGLEEATGICADAFASWLGIEPSSGYTW